MLLKFKGDLFWLDTAPDAEMPMRQLTRTLYEEADPKLSPDCKSIGFRKDYDLYSLDVESGRLHALTTGGTPEKMNGRLDWVYPEELQIPSAYWWSPDSKRLAYLQFDMATVPLYPQADYLASPPRPEPERYPKAGEPNPGVRLAIVDHSGGKPRFADLGDPREYLIARVNWLPDGKHLAVQRLNRIQNELTIFFVNAETLEAEQILTEKDEYWVNLSDDFTFLPTLNAFLWTSENTGYRHLYLYFLKDRYARQLTKGDWEVSGVLGVDASEQTVFFTATEKSPLERHVYALKLDGGSMCRLTGAEGTGCEFSPDGARGCAPFECHPPARPGDLFHFRNEGGHPHAADATVPAAYNILPVEFHTIKLPGGPVLYAKLIRPAGFQAGRKVPVIVQVYGGPHAQNVRNVWAGLTMDQVYAHNGFVVWQLDNRGTSGRGHAFETPVPSWALSNSRPLRELSTKKTGFVDEAHRRQRLELRRLHILNACSTPRTPSVGISGAPVVDGATIPSHGAPHGSAAANPEGYDAALPPRRATVASLLLPTICGRQRGFQNSLQMIDRLQKAGKPFDDAHPQRNPRRHWRRPNPHAAPDARFPARAEGERNCCPTLVSVGKEAITVTV